MALFDTVVAVLLLVCAGFLGWQLGPQGARGQPVPIVGLILLAVSYLLLTPWSETLFAALPQNSTHLASHLCGRVAIVLTALFVGFYLVPTPPTRRRATATGAVYAAAAVVLVYLFAVSPQRPHGAGFGWAFGDSPHMRLFWIIQSLVVIHAMVTLAVVAGRACAHEHGWRKVLLATLFAAAVVFSTHESCVVVIAVVWPDLPPGWMRAVTITLQIVTNLLLVAGTVAPAVLGTYRSTRIARSYLDHLTPLHGWLTWRYPQVCFRSGVSRRAETRVTDMLIEISDALRLLQHDAPELAAAHDLDDETILAAAHENPHHAAYELTAAQLFRARPPDAGSSPSPVGVPALPSRHAEEG